LIHLLVIGQDYGMSLAEAREMARARFGLSDEQFRGIEREGLQDDWAPL
jgi:hypothetical protein